MRILMFIGFIVAGSAVGLLSCLGDDFGITLFMTCLGAFFGAILGRAISGIGRGRSPGKYPDDTLRGLGTTDDDLLDNYWRDENHPQFMKPASPDSKPFRGAGGTTD